MSPHFLVINRYDDEDAGYPSYCADDPPRLSYVTRTDCLDALTRYARATPNDIEIVEQLEISRVIAAAKVLAARNGAFDGVVGLSEYDVLTAAEVRHEFGLSGPSVELVRGFRDKVEMKRRVATAGLPIPRFLPVEASTSVDSMLEAVGLPMVLKPRSGAASVGVQVLMNRLMLEDAVARDVVGSAPGELECEEYVSEELYHVDGVLDDGEPRFISVSGYLNTPLDFTRGLPLGSALLDPSPLRTALAEFAVACLRVLDLNTGCFHLEAIRRADGRLVFLEVGMRPGGAEVPALHREIFGVNLIAECFRAALGLPLRSPRIGSSTAASGWLVFPEPTTVPSRVLSSTRMRDMVPHIHAEHRPKVGEVFDGCGGYCRVPGRFRFSGPDERAVRSSIRQVMARYRVDFEPSETFALSREQDV
jgi:biotin carboxylase